MGKNKKMVESIIKNAIERTEDDSVTVISRHLTIIFETGELKEDLGYSG